MTEANDIPAIDDDLNTTVPDEKPEVWKMPEPVFRKTSGKLPKGFEENAGFSEEPEVGSEPDRSIREAELAPEPTPRSPVLKIVLVVLGLLAMIAFLVVFLTVVYFYFLR